MITILAKAASVDGRSIMDLAGLSTDTKPTGKLNGSSFTEIDTGDKYYYDEENGEWILPGSVEEGDESDDNNT